jgi:hypothetical protein
MANFRYRELGLLCPRRSATKLSRQPSEADRYARLGTLLHPLDAFLPQMLQEKEQKTGTQLSQKISEERFQRRPEG